MMINSKTNTLSKMMGASCERTDEVRGGRIAAAPNLNLKDDFDFALEHQLDQSEGICVEKDNIEPTFNKMWVTKSENATTSGDENGTSLHRMEFEMLFGIETDTAVPRHWLNCP